MDETEELETESVVDTPEDDDNEGFLPQPGDDEPETDEAEDGDEEEEAEGEAPDVAEVEINGKTYKVPAELKDGFLMQGDYTRKTQEVAELRKQLEPLLQQAQEASEAETQAQFDLASVSVRMKQLESTDWSQFDQMDLMQAQIEYQGLQTRAQQLQGVMQQAQQQRLSIAEQETARRFDEGRRVLAEKIPNFAARAPKLAEHAIKEYGFTADDLSAVDDPRFFIALNRLVELEDEVKSRKVVAKAKQAVEIKPAAKIKGKTGNIKTGLHDGLSTAEWIKRDQARSAQRR